MFQKIIHSIENYPLTLKNWILAFFSLVALRMLGEYMVMGMEVHSMEYFIGSVLVAFLFFLFAYLLMLMFIRWYLKESLERVANILLWGYFLIILPPLIDRLWCGSKSCWSFYVFDSLSGLGMRFLTFFGDSPGLGITYGVRVEVALAVIFITFYLFLKTRKVAKSLLGGLVTYAILFFLGTFPSWITFLLLPGKKMTEIENFDIAGVFLSPVKYFSISNDDFLNTLNVKMNLIYAPLVTFAAVFFFWVYSVKFAGEDRAAEKTQSNEAGKFWAVVKNIRWVQIMIHAGLILTGAGLGAFYFPANVPDLRGQPLTDNIFSFLALANLILAAILAWLASVFLNDWEDLEIDKITNKNRPLVSQKVKISEYNQYFLVSFILSLALALSVGIKFFFIIFIYQIIGWIYSAWPLRLKRFPIVASSLSSLSLSLLFMSGFMLLSDGQNITAFPAQVFWLLIISFTISLPIKDLKDIEGDRANGVWTIPVLLGETWSRFAIGLGIFISFSLSVVWLNAKILFLPAMIFGAASFWALQNKKISPRRVHIWVFGLLFIYVILIFFLVFYPAIAIIKEF